MSDDAYKIAYLREQQARLLAEKLLEDKTRELYENLLDLKSTVHQLKATQSQLIQSEKMASLGQLTAGVAHEINNPIAYSYSNLNYLSDNLEQFFKLDELIQTYDETQNNATEILRQYKSLRQEINAEYLITDTPNLLLDIIDGMERVKKIVNNLKKISYKGDADLIPCNINDVIKDCLKVLANELKFSMAIQLSLTDCDDILGQPSELSQVFINLFMNAMHACKPQSTLSISTQQVAQHVVIHIKDNGKGISKQHLSRIFDPFFTTKPIGEGTGLGLPVSHGIIEKHHGKIEIESELDVGTCFKITLPIAPQ